ncbi:DUF2637 domain-containing protein [Streptomyces sp. NPDC096136]|uniref:DUF2637 domain-containing protein n=1 Tax=Streptomyces sp. NPDC096136 TaxID=3366076 RepID=UPI00381F5767
MAAMQLTRTHRILVGVVVAGAVVIAGIGFAGSYAAVRALALKKGFGSFSLVFPIGIDAGICVLLALDLLLTWIRIPFPLLRQTAWLLTAATIAFNGAAAWPDPLGVGMHAVIPVLFVVTVEAARHAVGRIADITADRHMEGVRITRWLLSPVPTFKLWRRMKLWELRSYEQAVGMEQDRLIYQARLQARYGRAWRRKAPVEALMPLRLARIGVPLAQTAPEGLAAAGIDPVLLPPAGRVARAVPAAAAAAAVPAQAGPSAPALAAAPEAGAPRPAAEPAESAESAELPEPRRPQGPQGPQPQPQPQPQGQEDPEGPEGPGAPDESKQWEGLDRAAARRGQAKLAHAPAPFAVAPEAMPAPHDSAWFAGPKAPQAEYGGGYDPQGTQAGPDGEPLPEAEREPDGAAVPGDEEKFAEAAYEVFRAYIDEFSSFPNPEQLDGHLADRLGATHPGSAATLKRLMPALKQRYQRDLENEHIA